MAEEIKKVIEIKVKGERTVQDLKNNIKELQNALVNLDTGTEDYDKVVKQLTLDQAKLSEVMNAGKATVVGAAGSYNALKKEMADLKKVWAQLAPSAERDEVGQRIKSLNDQLKKLDASTGNFQRNVGDYKNAFVSAFNVMGGSVNGLVGKVGNLAQMFQSFGKGGAIGLALAGAAGLVATISNGIKSSADNTIAWRKQMAQFKPLLNDIDTLAERIAGNFLTLVGSISNFFKFIGSGFKYGKVMGEANDETSAAVDLVNKQIKNEQELQNLMVLEASAQTRLNKLKAIAADTDNKTYAERKAALEEIDAIEQTYDNRRVAAAKEAFEIQVANRKGEKASLDELNKERELYIAYLQAKSDAQSKDIAREKELYQLQKEAGQEALDYRIRILESERNLLETEISMVEANTIEEYNLRRAVADKEYEIAVASAEKEKKNMTLKNSQLLEAEKKHYADLQQIEEDFTAGYLQRIKDQTDTAVANTVDAWKKSIPKLEGLLKEYNTKLAGGKPATQTSDEWNKELAQMRDEIRKTWIDGINDIFGQVDNIVFQNLQKDFKIWQEGTADYLASEITAYENAYNEIASKREEILKSEKMEGETDEQFLERQKQKTLAFDKNLYEMRKKIVEGYHNWYFKAESENNTKILLASRKNFEEYVKGIPHSVWYYMFKPQDYTMGNMEQDLKNAEEKYKIARQNIEKIMRAKWKEAGKKEEDYNFNEAFNMLPEDVQKAYLADLEDFVDKENKLLKQRLDNWIGLGNAIGDLFGNVADIYEEDIKNRQKKGKIDQKQAEKEFENLKALQIAQAVINTLAGSVGAFLQASEAYPAPYGQIIGGVAAAAATAAGIAQIAKIKNTEYGGSGSVTSTPTAAATPVVDPYQPDYTRNLTTASDVDTLNAGLEKANLYVKVTDIDAAQEQGRTRVAESSF